MQSLNPTRSVARRGRDLLIVGALLVMSSIVLGGLGFLVLLLFSSNFVGGLIIVIGIGVALAGVVVMIRGLTLRTENETALAVDTVLKQVLDDRYTLVRNISYRGLGYIDAILIGPPGVLVMRISDLIGIFQNEGADWLERKGGKPFMLSRLNLTRECVADVYALRKFLAARQLANVPVFGIVVFTHPHVQISARQPVVPIANLQTLMTTLRGDYLREDRIESSAVEKTVNAVYH